MSDFFVDAFNELCVSRYGLPVHSINFIENEDVNLDASDLLDKFNILHDEIYRINYDGDSTAIAEYSNSIRVGGLTIFIKVCERYQAVVFINKNPLPFLNKAENEDFLAMCHYMYLIHELGHVDDFFNGNNFSRGNRVFDLVKAEAYADIFALKKLKSRASPVNSIALSWYAKGVLENAHGNDFYRQVLVLIKKKILEANIRKWASA